MSKVFDFIDKVVGKLSGDKETHGAGGTPASPTQASPPPASVASSTPSTPAAPAVEDAQKKVSEDLRAEADAAVRGREEEDARKRRRGRAATILTGSRGAGTPTSAVKRLLGE